MVVMECAGLDSAFKSLVSVFERFVKPEHSIISASRYNSAFVQVKL